MNDNRIADVAWRFDHHPRRAVLTFGDLRLSIDPEAPHGGVYVEMDSHGRWQGSILGVSSGRFPEPLAPLVETYPRGSRLFAEYGPLPERPYRVDAVWQGCPIEVDDAAAFALRLHVSVRTDVLESRPALLVSSEIPGTTVRAATRDEPVVFQEHKVQPAVATTELSTTCLVIGGAGGGHRYVEMIDPHDCAGLVVRAKPGAAIQTQWKLLLGPCLEKGVIRRTRLQAILLPPHTPDAVPIACLETFSKSLAPLSA